MPLAGCASFAEAGRLLVAALSDGVMVRALVGTNRPGQDHRTSNGEGMATDHLPNPAQPGPERSPENDAIYRQIRDEIHFEISLISARVNWLLTGQAFLFVPLTLGAGGRPLRQSVFYPAIPILGVALCALVLVSILAAVWRGRQWRQKARQGAYAGTQAHLSFDIVLPHTPMIPVMGLIGGIGVPIALITVWLWLLVAPPAPPT
jgi:hypothetical protein